MNKLLILLPLIFTILSCERKQDTKEIRDEISRNIEAGSNPSAEIVAKWIGKYEFSENVEGVTKGSYQSWTWTVNVEQKSSLLLGLISVDGFQTSTRIEAEVKVTEKTAEFIFMKYLPENMFEIFKTGDRLFTFEINDKGEMITNWDKMKAYVIKNQVNGKVMFRKIVA